MSRGSNGAPNVKAADCAEGARILMRKWPGALQEVDNADSWLLTCAFYPLRRCGPIWIPSRIFKYLLLWSYFVFTTHANTRFDRAFGF